MTVTSTTRRNLSVLAFQNLDLVHFFVMKLEIFRRLKQPAGDTVAMTAQTAPLDSKPLAELKTATFSKAVQKYSNL